MIDTYRFAPHSKGDDFRDPQEIEERLLRDPLTVAGANIDDARRAELETAVEERLARAVEDALAAPVAGGGA